MTFHPPKQGEWTHGTKRKHSIIIIINFFWVSILESNFEAT